MKLNNRWQGLESLSATMENLYRKRQSYVPLHSNSHEPD